MANTPKMRVATHLYWLEPMSRVGDKGKGLETGRWCYWQGFVNGKKSPLEKGVLSTKKEERKNELKMDRKEGRGTRDGQRLVSCGKSRGKENNLVPKGHSGRKALSSLYRRKAALTDTSCASNETDW